MELAARIGTMDGSGTPVAYEMLIAQMNRTIAGNIVIHGATSIPLYEFSSCNGLNGVSCPDVVSIGEYAFNNCQNITDFFFPSLESIDSYATRYTYAAKTFNAPHLKEIKNYAFNAFGSREAVVRFDEITSLGGGAFNSSRLKEFHSSAPFVQTVNDHVFNTAQYLSVLDIPNAVSIRNLFTARTSSIAGKLDVYLTGRSADAILAMDYFPWGADSMSVKSNVKFHAAESEMVMWNGTEWAVYPDIVSSRGGGGTKCLTPRRSYRRLARPSARFCAHSHRWEVAA